ncbi:MAG: peptidoglycan DD-metalloendopeptidase family protein [Clostridia bacterium]|nr:peptidoglycan DD-metalloendopeptidase family protein [Clostridia bacterium]
MNIKKLFPEKSFSKKGLIEFLDKKGFYIVLVLCIAIVAATVVIVTTHNITSSNTEFENKLIPEETGSAINTEEKVAAQLSGKTTTPATIQKDQPKAAEPAKPSAPASKKDANGASTVKADTPASKPATAQNKETTASQKFIVPVLGPVTVEFAQDKLVYSKTLEEWRTHSGIDIGGEKGTPVKAVADGVVSEVKNDPRYGITVIINHNNGIKTVYANLASDEIVSPNQKVKQGEVIGSIGTTAAFESAEQPHLHFEVLKNNEPADPLAYLPKIN